MGKYDSCEHCLKTREEGELLSTVEYWQSEQWNGGKIPSYHLVCEDCFETRKQWCTDIFPDSCERCGAKIEVGDHCFEGRYNRDGKEIAFAGLTAGETCRIVCENCLHRPVEG